MGKRVKRINKVCICGCGTVFSVLPSQKLRKFVDNKHRKLDVKD